MSAWAPASVVASKLHTRPGTSSPCVKLRGSNGCSGWRVTTCSRAVPVRSITSSSSPTGTAGGLARFVRSSLPVYVISRRSAAAISASSSSWRSSVRASRSPTCASSSSRSSPSRGVRRGNTPSSRPSRQTTRCGTERIGTSVQTVRWPVRKFARVGRPRSRSASTSRSSPRVSGVAWPAASSTRSSSRRCSSPRCQPSSGAVAVSASAAFASAVAHALIGFGAARAATAAESRSSSSAKRPARSIAPLSTSSSGSTPANSRWSSSVIVTPSSRRSRPARQVPVARAPSLKGSRCAASSPQRMPLARTHSSIRPRSSSSRSKRRRTGSRSARSSTCEAVRRPSASSTSRATTPSTGFVWRSERSANRTRRSGPCSGSSSVAPNAAWISGANVSMSGHITITSRGSSVGSSASSCRIASRSTSTWRARPWQECTWTLRSGSSDGSGAASSRTAAWMRASSVPVAGSFGCRWSTRGCAWASTSCSSRESWPQDASSGLRGSVAVGSSARRATGGWPREPLPERRRGVQQEEVDVAVLGQRLEHGQTAGGQPRQPEQGEARRQVGELRLRAQARARVLDPLGRPGLGDRRVQAPPQLGLPAVAAAARPLVQQRRPVQRVAVVQRRQVADGREAPVGLGQVLGEQRQPRLAEAAVDDLQQRPDRPLGQPRVGLRVDARGRGDRGLREPPRRREVDVRADAVRAPGRSAQARRQALRQPPLHPARGDGDDLGRERVGRRHGEQLAERGDQPVGPLGAVDVERQPSRLAIASLKVGLGRMTAVALSRSTKK